MKCSPKSEILKSLTPLEEISRVSYQYFAFKVLSSLKVKMGCGGQEEQAGKFGITLDEKKGGIMGCGPFSIP